MFKKFKERLSYDPVSGWLVWTTPPKSLDNNLRIRSAWISRCVGKRAGNRYKKKDDRTAYRKITFDGETYKEHHVIWMLQTGDWPNGILDHIDGNGENNRWCNLREVSNGESSKNMPRKSTNTSGRTGVSWDKRREKWIASIKVGGKYLYLGGYSLFEDAVKVREDAEKLYGFHENHGR